MILIHFFLLLFYQSITHKSQQVIISKEIIYNNGFKKEGVLRDSLFKNNKYYDLIVYSILKRDYFDN